jgi:hypothetical protein
MGEGQMIVLGIFCMIVALIMVLFAVMALFGL